MSNLKSPRSPGRVYTPAEHAKALSIILEDEFDTPFLFQNASNGDVVGESGKGLAALEPSEVAKVCASGQAHATGAAHAYHLVLPLFSRGKPILVGSALLPSLAPGRADDGLELRRTQKWVQAVCERLRCSDHIVSNSNSRRSDQAAAQPAWETVLGLDHLLGHLRLHKNATANQIRILHAAWELIGVESLVFVPENAGESVLMHGASVLSETEARQLVAHVAQEAKGKRRRFLCNDLRECAWITQFPSLRNLLALPLRKGNSWVLAVNKKANEKQGASTRFRQMDAVQLGPFLAVLALHEAATERFADLKELLVGLARALTSALDARDQYTCGHSERVARIAMEIARELDMNDEGVHNVYLAGLLHDIGKIGVADSVLFKAGALTPQEREHMQQHVTIGYAILADLHQLRDLLPGVLHHHEQFDGGGYPHGLAGESIPLLARILAVADSYDAMSTTRPYRVGMSPQRIEEIFAEGAGSQWDRRVVEAFMRCRSKIYPIRQRGIGASLRQALDGAMGWNQQSSLPLKTPLSGNRDSSTPG